MSKKLEKWEKWNWTHDGLFFLSRTPVVEVITVGDPCDADSDLTGSLYQFADQYVGCTHVPDRWGRNYIDLRFLALCSRLYAIVTCIDNMVFKSLTTQKVGDKYMVRVQYNEEDVEMGVEEMFNYFTDKLKEINHANCE